MNRRILTVALVPTLAFANAAAASSSKPASWAAPQIRVVTAAGLMDGRDVASFRASDPLTAQSLEDLAFNLKTRLPAPPVEEPAAPVFTPPTATDPTLTDPLQ